MTSITLEIDPFSLVFLLGAAQGMFLVLALLTVKQGNRQANLFLGLFILIFSLTLVDVFLQYTHYYARFPRGIAVAWPTNYLYGPLLLLYTHALVKKGWVPNKLKISLHFLPFALAWIVMLPIFMLSGDIKAEMLYGDGARLFETSTDRVKMQIVWAFYAEVFVRITTIVQIGVYLVIGFKRLREHGRRLKDEFSYTEYINLNWLRYIILVSFGLWLIFAFTELFADYFQIEEQFYYGQHVIIAILIYIMGYFGLRQPDIFKKEISANQDKGASQIFSPRDSIPKKEKYEKSSLDSEQAAELAIQLKEKMQAEGLFLDNQLTLPRLAKAIEITPHYLSQVINGHLGKNFFDFVNEYRIEEAKHRIARVENGRMNVYAIALDSGFNSKSAFYTAFKRYTGMTPSAYKQTLPAMESEHGGR